MRGRHRCFLSIVFATALLLVVPKAQSCSICRCGDPAFATLGSSLFTQSQWRIALDWDRIEKSNGISEGATTVGRDAEVENRSTVMLSRLIQERLNLMARIPYSWRRLESTDFASGTPSTVSTSGFSDPELVAQVRLWASAMGGLGRSSWVSALVGIKTPWGRNNLSRDGERLDEHAQPGTGSTDLIAGLAGTHILGLASTGYASGQYRHTGTNRFDYRYGRVWLANAGVEHKFGTRLDGVLELNYRHAGQDRIDSSGQLDPNTGGGILYVQPRLVIPLGDIVVARLAVVIPVADALYGDQTERTIVNAGVTLVP